MIKNRRKQSKKFHKAVHTQEVTGSSPVVSTKNHRNRLILVIFFRNPQLFERLNFRRFFKTHTLTHTGKRAGGNNGHKSAREHGSPDGKGHKMSRKHETSFYQSVGKDEVSGSNPDSSSTKTALFA